MRGDLGDRRAVRAQRADLRPHIVSAASAAAGRRVDRLDRGLQRQVDAGVGAPGRQRVRPYQARLDLSGARDSSSSMDRSRVLRVLAGTTGRRCRRARPASPSRSRSGRCRMRGGQRREVGAVADPHQQQVAVLHLDHRLQHVSAVEQLRRRRSTGSPAPTPPRRVGRRVRSACAHWRPSAGRRPTPEPRAVTPDTSRANFETSQSSESRCVERGGVGHSSICSSGLSGVRPRGVHAAEVAADARADGVGITYRNRVRAGTEFGRRLYLVVAIVASVRSAVGWPPLAPRWRYGIRRSGYQPGAGSRTGKPCSVCVHRRVLRGLRRRPAVIPDGLPVQIAAVGQIGADRPATRTASSGRSRRRTPPSETMSSASMARRRLGLGPAPDRRRHAGIVHRCSAPGRGTRRTRRCRRVTGAAARRRALRLSPARARARLGLG